MKIKCMWCGLKTGEIVGGKSKYKVHNCRNKKQFIINNKLKINENRKINI